MTFSTTDLQAAAYLLSQGATLVRTLPGGFVTFVFDDTGGLPSRCIQVWNNGDPVGSLKAYAVAEQKLRREIRRAA